MANLFKDKRSPYWQLQYKDLETGRWKKSSTGLRHDCKRDTAKAREIKAKYDQREARADEVQAAKEGWDWVRAWIERRRIGQRTRERYLECWAWIAMWLEHASLHAPRQIRYRHAEQYVDWRIGLKKRSGKSVTRNTALHELKVFRLIMSEAVRLEYAEGNPFREADLRKDPTLEKREFTDEELIRIHQALKDQPEWMQLTFAISLHTGCRLRETRIPMRDIDLAAGTIHFAAPKGGEGRAFSIPMPDALRPLLTRLAEEERLYTVPQISDTSASRDWTRFLRQIGVFNASFHCFRVTHITRMRRAGVPQEAAKHLVNHASSQIHEQYVRHQVDSVRQYANAVQLPALDDNARGQSQKE